MSKYLYLSTNILILIIETVISVGKVGKKEKGKYPQIVSLAGGTVDVGEAVLVHNPVGLYTSGGFPGVKNQRLLYA